MVDAYTYKQHSARTAIHDLVTLLSPNADKLDCKAHLDHVLNIANSPSWADRQIALFKETGDPREVVRQLSAKSRLSTGEADS